MKVLALSVDPYDFKDEESGRSVAGCNLTIVTEYAFPSEDKSSGHPCMKMAMPTELAAHLRGKLPAVLDINTTLKKGAGGKATTIIISVGALVPFNLLNILVPK
jgi:hypothetical protein